MSARNYCCSLVASGRELTRERERERERERGGGGVGKKGEGN